MKALGLVTWRVERRPQAGSKALVISVAAGLAGAVLLTGLLFALAGANPLTAYASLLQGAFGSKRAFAETLVKATPLLLTGLAACVAFRARLWNIGAEGQVFAGAMLAYWLQHNMTDLSAPIQLSAAVAGGMLGGALYAGLAAVLKTHLAVDEVISTVMLNYIIIYVLSLLLQAGPWSEAGGFFEQTAKVDAQAILPVVLPGTRLHAGFVFALAAAMAAYVIVKKTPLGFEIRAAGSNLRALAVQGTDARRLTIVVFLLSGALAGLAGVTEVYGVHYRLKAGAITGYGYAGIIVAILGRLHPFGVVVAAVALGALLNGATLLQIRTGVPAALIYAVEAILLLFFLAGWAASRFSLKRAGR